MKRQLAAIATSALLLLSACSGASTKTNNTTSNTNQTEAAEQNKNGEGLTVVTSTYFIKDLAEAIAKDKAQVTCLIPKGQGVHGFEPAPKDMNLMGEADLFIYNGAGLESWTDALKEGLSKDAEALEASKGIELIAGGHHHDHDHDHAHEAADHDHDHAHDHEATGHDHNHAHDHDHDHNHEHEATDHDHEHDHGGKDPHVWMSVKNARIMAKNIADALIAKDPDNKAFYEDNLKALDGELDALDQSFKETLANAKTKDIVVSHEAYGYLAKEYGLNQIPIEGINSEGEPDPKAMKEIIEHMKDKGIKTVFTEPEEDDKIAQTIASETGAEVKELDPLEYESDQNYLERMKNNLKVLESALQ